MHDTTLIERLASVPEWEELIDAAERHTDDKLEDLRGVTSSPAGTPGGMRVQGIAIASAVNAERIDPLDQAGIDRLWHALPADLRRTLSDPARPGGDEDAGKMGLDAPTLRRHDVEAIVRTMVTLLLDMQ